MAVVTLLQCAPLTRLRRETKKKRKPWRSPKKNKSRSDLAPKKREERSNLWLIGMHRENPSLLQEKAQPATEDTGGKEGQLLGADLFVFVGRG